LTSKEIENKSLVVKKKIPKKRLFFIINLLIIPPRVIKNIANRLTMAFSYSKL